MTKEELLKQYKKLAYKIAVPYCRGFPKSTEDIQSAAMEGLCKGVNDVLYNKKFEYAGAVIYLNIRRCILDEISSIPLIPIPNSLIRKYRLECYEKKKPFKINDLYPQIFNDPDLNLISQIGIDGFRYIKQKEILEGLRLDAEELSVLSLRLEEQTVREIAQELSCSKSQIQKIIERIRLKWKKRF